MNWSVWIWRYNIDWLRLDGHRRKGVPCGVEVVQHLLEVVILEGLVVGIMFLNHNEKLIFVLSSVHATVAQIEIITSETLVASSSDWKDSTCIALDSSVHIVGIVDWLDATSLRVDRLWIHINRIWTWLHKYRQRRAGWENLRIGIRK